MRTTVQASSACWLGADSQLFAYAPERPVGRRAQLLDRGPHEARRHAVHHEALDGQVRHRGRGGRQ